tara:strand:- start:519 stop:983 length:465 start_codon:yes stop_codon:yes gene_type:complete
MNYWFLLGIIFFNLFVDSKFYIDKSTSHNKGIFANRFIKKGEHLFVCADYRNKQLVITRLGSLINHCDSPNASFQIDNGICSIYARKDLEKGEEIVADYNEIKLQIPIRGSESNWVCPSNSVDRGDIPKSDWKLRDILCELDSNLTKFLRKDMV